MRFKSISYAIVIALTLSSCAGGYNLIKPDNFNYTNLQRSTGIEYAIQHGVMDFRGNKKYAKREENKSVKVIAVEFTNNTNRTINFRNDVKIFEGNRQVFPMETRNIYTSLKQPAGLYMLWGLLWLFITNCDEYGNCTSTPIPVGLVIGGINTGIASGANKKFFEEISLTNLLDVSVEAGETVRGLIGITSDSYQPLSLKLND